MKKSEAQRIAENVQKLTVLLAVMTTHVQHFMEGLLSVSNAITEAAFTVEDIIKDLPPEVYKNLKIKKVNVPEDLVELKDETLVSLIEKMLKKGRVKP